MAAVRLSTPFFGAGMLWIFLTVLSCHNVLADVCSKARHHFAKNGVSETDVFSSSNEVYGSSTTIEGMCPGSQQCCPIHAAPALEKLSRTTYHDYLREALNDAQSTLRKLANQLKGSVCRRLQDSQNTSDVRMTRYYSTYYTQNKHAFLAFFCKLTQVAGNCQKCHATVWNETREFLRRVQIVLLRLKTGHQLLDSEFEECALKHTVVEPQFGKGIMKRLIKDLQESICTSCDLQQALDAAAHLMHSSRTTQPSQICLNSMRCMMSCTCCRSDQDCGLRPCYQCCTTSLSPCLTGITQLDPTFQRTMKVVVKYSSQLHKSGHADRAFDQLPAHLNEVITYGLDIVDDLQAKVEHHCGKITDHALDSQPGPAVDLSSCLMCDKHGLHSLKEAYHRVSQIGWLQNTFRNLKERVCQRHSVHRSAHNTRRCHNCSTCPRMSDEEQPSVEVSPYSEQLTAFHNALPAVVQQQLPHDAKLTNTPVKVTPVHGKTEDSSGNCDDEDSDCGSTGSGERDDLVTSTVRTTTNPETSQVKATPSVFATPSPTKPHLSTQPTTAKISGSPVASTVRTTSNAETREVKATPSVSATPSTTKLHQSTQPTTTKISSSQMPTFRPTHHHVASETPSTGPHTQAVSSSTKLRTKDGSFSSGSAQQFCSWWTCFNLVFSTLASHFAISFC